MKKILMLATGGTIASKDSGQGLTPAITSQEILNYVPAIGQLCQVEAIQLMNLDKHQYHSPPLAGDGPGGGGAL